MKPDDLERADDRVAEAEGVLRRLASVAAPEGLEQRVHRRLRAETQGAAARRGWFWGLGGQRAGFAFGAVLLAALAGGGWEAYQVHLAHVADQARRASAVTATPVAGAEQGGFSAAKGMRVPPTLTPLRVPPAPKKKVGAKGKKAAPAVAAQAQP